MHRAHRYTVDSTLLNIKRPQKGAKKRLKKVASFGLSSFASLLDIRQKNLQKRSFDWPAVT